LTRGEVVELDMHINDPAFADAAASTLLELLRKKSGGPTS
jgi:uncharacterized protein (UPF0261 family)